MCIKWISWISCVSHTRVLSIFDHVGDSFDDFESCFPRVVIHLCHFLTFFYWTDPCSIGTITSSSFYHLVAHVQNIQVSGSSSFPKKPWGFAEHCWTTLTLSHRSCYCRSFSSYHWSDFRWWTTGLDATKHVEFSTNDDDNESNTDELTVFMLVCVSTISGASNGYFWSGTLRF